MEATVKFDCSLEFPPIVDLLSQPGPNESDVPASDFGQQKTKMQGIISPLIKLNNTTIDWSQVIEFSLKDDKFPTVKAIISDSLGLQETFDKPRADNILQIQILPPFDNAYKKINLCFSITHIGFEGSQIYVEGTYNVPGWNDSVMRAYGYSTTYELCESIAHELKLGMCSNIDGTSDARWLYNANKTRYDMLQNEIDFGGNERCVLDCWVDYWNNINLIDIYERYNTKDDNLRVWVPSTRYPQIEASSNPEPQRIEAAISNHLNFKTTPLYCTSFEQTSSFAKNISDGTDKILEAYNMSTFDSDTMMVVDGNIKKNIVVRYGYLGEEFGNTNYLMNRVCKMAYKQKLSSQTIVVTLQTPCLGLMKGGKVNFYWYEVNEYTKDRNNQDTLSNIELPLDDTYDSAQQDSCIINSEISGQYYIVQSDFSYRNHGNTPQWEHILTLSRKADDIQQYVTEENRPTDKSSFDEPAPSISVPIEQHKNDSDSIYDTIDRKQEAETFLEAVKKLIDNNLV